MGIVLEKKWLNITQKVSFRKKCSQFDILKKRKDWSDFKYENLKNCNSDFDFNCFSNNIGQ